jgi:lipopolysaccharide biosynthesis protein
MNKNKELIKRIEEVGEMKKQYQAALVHLHSLQLKVIFVSNCKILDKVRLEGGVAVE